ncbi:MAG TPA: hypothetical protein VMH34_03135 [Gammaproteobacteria bacterium]|nr:hypothetical protein [Gammaproteobacteria bacterium]
MALRLGGRSKFYQPFDVMTAVLFKIIQALTYFFVLSIIFMNPVSKKGIIDPKAEYIITVHWPDNNPNDIDTWVEEPDGNLVWFQNKEAGLVHLDRDDRGVNDSINVNGQTVEVPLRQEVVTIRGTITGEYVVNIHYYASQDDKPVDVDVTVDKVNPQLEVVYYGTLTLHKAGDELTAVRFTIGSDGKIANINHIQKSLTERIFGKGQS